MKFNLMEVLVLFVIVIFLVAFSILASFSVYSDCRSKLGLSVLTCLKMAGR